MRKINRGNRFGLIAVLAILVPAMAHAQSVFTYTANDYKTIILGTSGSAAISVGTLVIIQPSADFQRTQVPMQNFLVKFRPPQVDSPKLLEAAVGDQIVNLNVQRSNFDGDMEATVQIPASLGNNPELKIFWGTTSNGAFQTTVKPTLEAPNLKVQSLNVHPNADRTRQVFRVTV